MLISLFEVTPVLIVILWFISSIYFAFMFLNKVIVVEYCYLLLITLVAVTNLIILTIATL